MSARIANYDSQFRQRLAELRARIDSLAGRERNQLQMLADDMERSHRSMQRDCALAQRRIGEMQAAERSVKTALESAVAAVRQVRIGR